MVLMMDVPPEILLDILQLLDTSDILNIRQTCRTLHRATYDRAIWMALLQEQVTYIPFPSELLRLYHQNIHLDAYSTSTIESIIVKAQRTSEAWLTPRWTSAGTDIVGKLHKIRREDVGSKLLGLEMVLDRWIVAVYFEGAVRVYDVGPPEAIDTLAEERIPVLRASLVKGDPYISYAVSMGPSGKTLFIALARPRPPHTIEIFEINFDLLSQGREISSSAFHLMRTIYLPSYKNIKALNSAERQIVLSLPTGIEVIPWDADYADVEVRKVITVQNEELDSLVDGIVAVTFIGPYLLIFRTHTLSIHDYKGARNWPSTDLKHIFSLTFRQISFSECSMSCNPVSQVEAYEMSIFAYDVIQGLFYYTVRLSVPSSSSTDGIPPSLDVHLTGVYPLAVGIIQPPASYASSTTTYYSNFNPRSPSSSSSASRENPASDADYGSRGFLSAHCVGPQAKRAIWVERKRSSTTREVHVWSREKPWDKPVYISGHLDGNRRGSQGESEAGRTSSAVEMKKRVVYSLNSYDLRDDINYCAFGEVNGTIVLGHRSGDISVLKL